ncbi:MAG: hypothetical protein ACP5D2_01995 [Candidatus Nanoarchaeia archaeon]
MDKRGLTLTIEIVLIIILSIAVLATLIYFLNMQTGFFSNWLSDQKQESNVDMMAGRCDNLLKTEQVYSYCCEEKEVRYYEDDLVEQDMTCNEFAQLGVVDGLDVLECEC